MNNNMRMKLLEDLQDFFTALPDKEGGMPEGMQEMPMGEEKPEGNGLAMTKIEVMDPKKKMMAGC
jgi:hypothetical protein